MRSTISAWNGHTWTLLLALSVCFGTAVTMVNAAAVAAYFSDGGSISLTQAQTPPPLAVSGKLAPLDASAELASATVATPVAHSAVKRTLYIGAPGSKVVVRGHSTLHDWSVTSSTLNGKVILSGHWRTTHGQAISIALLHLRIPVTTLKGSDGSGMTNTIMRALHRKQHPTITFIVTHAKLLPQRKTTTGSYLFRTAGLLKINGIMRKEAMTLRVGPLANGSLTVQTLVKLKMRDFNVTPPTAMFGIIRSGNAITVSATWKLAKAVHSAKIAPR
ncbi:MAG: YceI family protein [Phycisphaerae bacterium]